MKLLITFLVALIGQLAVGQTRISILNGDWNDPSIWSPTGVPLLNEDTVIVANEISFQGDLEVGINELIINPSGQITGTGTFGVHGNLLNNGIMNITRLLVGDGNTMTNNNTMNGSYIVPTNLVNNNNGLILMDTLIITEYFQNNVGGEIILDHLLTGGANTENYGSIVTDSWMNDATTFGSGSYCIANCFFNTGSIGGGLDVCDNTPDTGGFLCDFDGGIIGAGVTTCTNSLCAVAGLEEVSDLNVVVFPNPCSAKDGFLNVRVPAGKTMDVTIVDPVGRVLASNKKVNDSISMEVSKWSQGCVFVIVSDGINRVVTKVIFTN